MSSEIYEREVREYLNEYRKFMTQFDELKFDKDIHDSFNKSQNDQEMKNEELLQKLDNGLSYYSETIAKNQNDQNNQKNVDDAIIQERCDNLLALDLITSKNKKLKKENSKLRRQIRGLAKILDNTETGKRELMMLRTANAELIKENMAMRKQYNEEVIHNDDLVDHIARVERDFIDGRF